MNSYKSYEIETTLEVRRQLSVYFAAASRTQAETAKAVMRDWSEFSWTSKWPHWLGKIPETPEMAAEFWQHDLQAISMSDVVLVYAQPDDNLRGALVEAGVALGFGKRVLVVGENAGFGTWQFHPGVARFVTLEGAWRALRIMAAG